MFKRLLCVYAIAAFSLVTYVQAEDQTQNVNPSIDNLLFHDEEADEAEATLACGGEKCHQEGEEEEIVEQAKAKLACDGAECTKKPAAATDARTTTEEQLEEIKNKDAVLAGCKKCRPKKRVTRTISGHHGKEDDHHILACKDCK